MPGPGVAPWAGEYVGIPFADHGRDRAGCDCWGLVRLVLRERFGIRLPSYSDRYPGTEDAAAVAALVRGERAPWRPVPKGGERPGDAVLVRLKGAPMHVGVVAGGGYMLHAIDGTDTVLERYGAPMWKRRILGFYRYEG